MIREALTPKEQQICIDLRMEVFVAEQGIPVEEEIDSYDEAASHYLAYLQDTPVGTARIIWTDQTAKIGRICLLKSARGTGLGAALVGHAIDVARNRSGVTRAELGAQCYAIGFYEKLGFAVIGPIYDDAGIDHRDMEMPLI